VSRREFSKAVRRDALKRSGGFCEAIGSPYSLPLGKRCNAPLSKGVHFDHVIPDSLGGEPTLDNCAATCPACNMLKAAKHDTPRAAKTKRQADKATGVVRPRQTIKSPGFPQTRVREPKPALPPRPLFTETTP
jgi:5-methylcytosine-specific restriction protein A